MKITGTSTNIYFDFENGHSITGTGEILTGDRFAVDTDSLKWDSPNKKVTAEDLAVIKAETESQITNSNHPVKIIFD
ncbi:hypothetical protein BSQ39_11620 [Loigolactobacillus backii]|uniref:hypothetical protein n=1 Tax=Loigolactobacillus backii TaxID=375175 RepID=UPI000C1CA01C|nr:hypothetical protein [Loigolactobacillus backii]PIO84162.1 hypothetical protein BSQ39_11620 [Loigolactobacillus backii]